MKCFHAQPPGPRTLRALPCPITPLKKRLGKVALWTGAAVALAFLAVPRLRSTLLPLAAAADRARPAAPPVLAAELAASESAVANARLQVEYCAIRAPLPGRTGELGAHEGDLVRAGDTAVSLVTIHQLKPINVTFSVPQQYLPALERSRAR